MTRNLLCLGLCVSAASVCSASAHATSVLIAPINEAASAEATDAAALTRAVETALLQRAPSLLVVTPRSLGDKLELDLVKACEGGDDGSCVAQFSDALGVDYVLRPTLARVGDVLLLTLSLYDAHKASVLAQGQRRADAQRPEALLDEIPGLVVEVGQRGGLPVRERAARPFPVLGAASLVGGAGLLLLAVAGGGFAAWQEARYQGAELPREDAAAWEGVRVPALGGATLAAVVGAALTGLGVLQLTSEGE